MKFKIKIVTVCKGLKVKEGQYCYGIRHSDSDWGEPITVEKMVLVNRYGFIISQRPLDKIINAGNKGYSLNEEEREVIQNREDKGWFYVNELFEQYDGGVE